MRQNLAEDAAPAGVATRFFSLQHTIDIIAKASPKQKIFIISRNSAGRAYARQGWSAIRKVSIGSMHVRKESGR